MRKGTDTPMLIFIYVLHVLWNCGRLWLPSPGECVHVCMHENMCFHTYLLLRLKPFLEICKLFVCSTNMCIYMYTFRTDSRPSSRWTKCSLAVICTSGSVYNYVFVCM